MNHPRPFFGISTPAAPVALQDADELERFVALLVSRGVRSYLEIGARYGGTFERVMMALPVGAIGVAVDFPGADFGDERSPEDLVAAARRIRESGRHAHVVLGPSGAPEVFQRVRAAVQGRYDAILIDGDHSYAGVRADWQSYGPLGRIVALHDIAAPEGFASRAGAPVEVRWFWADLKVGRAHDEIVEPGSVMGLGVIFNQE